MWKAPSLDTLRGACDSSIADNAELIRQIWKAPNRADLKAIVWQHFPDGESLFPFRDTSRTPLVDYKMAALDKLIQTFGPEYLGTSRKTGAPVLYCNAGDSYAETLISSGQTLNLSNWGDWIESNSVKPKGGF